VGISDGCQGKVALTPQARCITSLSEESRDERFSKMIMIELTFLNNRLAIYRAVKKAEEGNEELMTPGGAVREVLQTEISQQGNNIPFGTSY